MAASAEDLAMTGRAAILPTLLGSATVLLFTIAAEPVPHFIWNASESVPIGLYRL
jgi:type IV secretory pathway protease TraF